MTEEECLKFVERTKGKKLAWQGWVPGTNMYVVPIAYAGKYCFKGALYENGKLVEENFFSVGEGLDESKNTLSYWRLLPEEHDGLCLHQWKEEPLFNLTHEYCSRCGMKRKDYERQVQQVEKSIR